MKKQETTEERKRSLHDIDYRELKEIARKAEGGDETAKAEIRIIGDAIKKSEVFDKLSDITKDIVQGYIAAFNRIHETDFTTLDQVEKYLQDNGLSPEDDVNFEELVETMVVRPKKYVRTLGKLTDNVFSNKLTLKTGQTGKKKKLFLDKEKKISIFVSVNYDEAIEELGKKAKIPELTEDDRQVLDGIITNLYAGNFVMTYDMIYRGFSGKIDNGDIYIPDEIYRMIDIALDHFRGTLMIDNAPEVKIKGNKTEHFYVDGPILHFDRLKKAIINGKNIIGEKIGVIKVYDFPSLYKYAKFNGNEVDTRPIKLLNVPKINNTSENLKLKRYLYNRVIILQNNYKRHVIDDHKRMTTNRKILFESVFKYIGADNIDSSNAGRQKKAKVVKKIFTILDYWKDSGLIEGYTKTKKNGSNEIDGIEINFLKKLEEKNP